MFTNFVQNNTFRLYLYLVLFTFLIGVMGNAVSSVFHFGLTGTGFSLIIAGIVDFVAYFFSDQMIISASGAKPMSREMAPDYFALVEKLVRKANLPMPKLYLIRTEAMNAFATGRDQKHAVVVVTRGLLEKLQPSEVEGVVAHELAHIQNLDMRLMAVISILTGMITIFADMYWRASIQSKSSQHDKSGIIPFIGYVLAAIAPISALFIRLAISREREFRADATGARIASSARGLITALQKISQDQLPLPNRSPALAQLYISSPFAQKGWFDTLISTHPPVEERIQKLQAMR